MILFAGNNWLWIVAYAWFFSLPEQHAHFVIRASGEPGVWIHAMTPWWLNRLSLIATGVLHWDYHKLPLIVVFMHKWVPEVTSPIGPSWLSWYQMHKTTAHNFDLDLLLLICSVVGISDNSMYYQYFWQYVLIALDYFMPRVMIWLFGVA